MHYFGFIRSFGGCYLLFLKEVILRNKKPVVPTQHFSPLYLRIKWLSVVLLKSFVQLPLFTEKVEKILFQKQYGLHDIDNEALAIAKY